VATEKIIEYLDGGPRKRKPSASFPEVAIHPEGESNPAMVQENITGTPLPPSLIPSEQISENPEEESKDSLPHDENPQESFEGVQGIERKNMANFRSNMQIEYGEDIRDQMKKLTLSEEPNDSTGESGAHTPMQRTSEEGNGSQNMLEFRKLGTKKQFISPSVIQKMYKQINEYVDASYGKWQVSANFVIKIVEVQHLYFFVEALDKL
jgi:hypothetical protein